MTAPSGTLGIRPAAVPSWLALHGALLALPGPTPCAADPDSFTDPRPEDVDYTANMCRRCPVLAECGQFATANKESAGIWAGRDRTPTRGRPAAERKASA